MSFFDSIDLVVNEFTPEPSHSVPLGKVLSNIDLLVCSLLVSSLIKKVDTHGIEQIIHHR